jgi:hypothetical protein
MIEHMLDIQQPVHGTQATGVAVAVADNFEGTLSK